MYDFSPFEGFSPYEEYWEEFESTPFDAPYSVSPDYSEILIVIAAGIILTAAIVGLILYLLRGIGLYRMAKACHMPAPILAFISFADYYLLGKLAERSQMCYGKRTFAFRIVLLITKIISFLMFTTVTILVAIIGVRAYYSGSSFYDLSRSGLPLAMLIGLACLFSAAAFVFRCVAQYHVYRLFSPEHTVLCTVLSILIPVSVPVILLAISHRAPGAPVPASPYPSAPPTYTPPQNG